MLDHITGQSILSTHKQLNHFVEVQRLDAKNIHNPRESSVKRENKED
jgi:hypothetical protein